MIFESITGHQQQIKLLENAINNSRVAHAYLFEGPDGVGKRLVALSFAQGLLCATGNSCNSCSACRKVQSNSHPDLFLLKTDASSIKIEQIRTLQQQLVLRPFEANHKICLIDDAERLTPEAANALLKTLEEPQSGTLIILISSQADKLLPTIRSRCQRLTFSRLSQQELARHLASNLALSATDASVLAAVSDGSFKRAFGQNLDLYLKNRPLLIQSLSALSATSTIQTFELAEKLRLEKDLINEILEIFEMFFRDLLLYKKGFPTLAIINQDLLTLIQQQAMQFSTHQLLKKLEVVADARRHLSRNVNIHLALDHMLMQITHA